jgi:hypothetical protein
VDTKRQTTKKTKTMGESIRNEAHQEEETEMVSIIGTLWFALISCLIFASFVSGRIRSSMAKRFAIYSFITCLLEIPRFAEGIINGSIGKYEYSAHLLGSVPQFLSFTTIIVSLRRELFPTLFVVNVIVLIMALVTIVLCILSKNMHSFFESDYFFFYALYDAAKNVFMGILMITTGKKKLVKIRSFVHQQFPKAERNISNLLFAMGIATMCFISRMLMQVLKAVALSKDSKHIGDMRLYSLPFRIFDDFIPIGLPILPFLYILTRRQIRSQSGGGGGISESGKPGARGSGGQVSLYDYHFDDGNDHFGQGTGTGTGGGNHQRGAASTSMDSSRLSRWSAWSIAESSVVGGLGLGIQDLGTDDDIFLNKSSSHSLSGFSFHDDGQSQEKRDSDFEMSNTGDKNVLARISVTSV